MIERTLILIKPDAVRRKLIGEIITRFERKQLKIVAMKMMKITRELAEKHYEEHKGKDFFESLVEFITSGPLVAMIIEGKNAISVCRKIIGKTNPQEAEPGTIRGDFGIITQENLVHGSDSPESARREISIFFNESEIVK